MQQHIIQCTTALHLTASIAQWSGRQARVAKVLSPSPGIVAEWVRRQTVQSLWRKVLSPPEQTPGNRVGKTRRVKQV